MAISKAKKEVEKSVDNEIKELKNNIIEIKSLLEHQSEDAKHTLVKKGIEAKESLKKVANEVGTNVGEIFNNSKDSLIENKEKVAKQISKNPIKSTLIAAGAGAVIAMLLKK